MHMPDILTLLNKYIISTRFAMKFLTWIKQLGIKLLFFFPMSELQTKIKDLIS